MIPRSYKFPLRIQFVRFRARARRLVAPPFTLFYLPSTTTRLGIIVPKKVSKLATTRNWLKRLTYDTVYPLVKDKNLDCVIVYKPLPLKRSLATTKELINELTQTAGNI